MTAAMSQIGWFPRTQFTTSSQFVFQTPVSSSWTIREKISQRNNQHEECGPEEPEFGPSAAQATFDVQRDSNGQNAYMRIYVQVPHIGTEFESYEYRARQAAQTPHSEFFHDHHATMTPALLGIKEEVQGPDGFVPGGYITYIVFERVPGTRLADDQQAPWPGFPLHTFFQKFERTERDKIREQSIRSFAN
ncbi:unnamed protein product [Penicillium glandicola]